MDTGLLKRTAARRRLREALVAYLFVAPWIVGFIIFTGGPIVASLVLSFFRWKLISSPRYVGLDNFVRMFTADELFRQSVKVTFRYLVVSVPLGQSFALVLALLLNQKVRGKGAWRTVFYLPAVVAGSVLWMWMYNTNYGMINGTLAVFGIEGPNWLYDGRVVMTALIVKSLWNMGVPMVIYLAGLQGMPQSLYEAADIDGAGEWVKFWRMTLPMLSPVIFFQVVMGIIGGVQTFAEPYVMTRGGPMNATLFLGLHLYQTAFHYLEMGYASGMAWVMFVIIMTLTIVQFKLARSWVYYEGE